MLLQNWTWKRMKQIEVLPQTIYEFEADPRITATALELLKKV